jgi:hypothetical protein
MPEKALRRADGDYSLMVSVANLPAKALAALRSDSQLTRPLLAIAKLFPVE